jgi:hypothetical protein
VRVAVGGGSMVTVALRGTVGIRRGGRLGRGCGLFGGGWLDAGRRGLLVGGLLVSVAIDGRLVMLVHQVSPEKSVLCLG